MAAPWMRNGTYMVFRRLEQKVPEFRRFVQQQAARLGMDRELLAARMVGRWKSGAPIGTGAAEGRSAGSATTTPATMISRLATITFQRKCPYDAHIRKVYPRDDIALADAQRHRIIRRRYPVWPRSGTRRD